MTGGNSRVLLITVVVLAVLALVLRSHGLDQSVVTFHATRHYRSALLARACYGLGRRTSVVRKTERYHVYRFGS